MKNGSSSCKSVNYAPTQRYNGLMMFSANETSDMTNSSSNSTKGWNIALGYIECYFDISDEASCEKNVVKPIMGYVKLGINESRKFYKKHYVDYRNKVTQWRSSATEFVAEFTHHDISCSKGCNYFSLAQKAMKKLKSMTFNASTSLAGINISSAGLSFVSGIVSATKSDVTRMLVFCLLDIIRRFLTLVPSLDSKANSATWTWTASKRPLPTLQPC